MIKINQDTFKKEVLESSQIVLVNFWAPWCGLCIMLNPILNKIESQWHEQIKIVSINADNNLHLVNNYRLSSLPTLIILNSGQVVHRFDNFHNREDIYNAINQAMSKFSPESA